MSRFGTLGLGLLSAALLTTPVVAQDATGMLSSGMLGWQESGVSDIISGTDITGYVDTAYTFNFNSNGNRAAGANVITPGGVENPGRVFDTRSNELALQGFALDFNRGTSSESTFGYHVTAIFGDDASVVNSVAGDVFAGEDYSLTNANVQVHLGESAGPLNGTVLTVGRFESAIGAERIHSNANDNFSRSFLFGLAIPLTHTGVMAQRTLMQSGDSDLLTGRIGWVNGWNSINDVNNSGSLMFGGDLTPTDFLTIDIDAIWGAEQNDTGNAGASHVNSDKLTLVDVVATLSAPEDMAQNGMEFLRQLKLQLNLVWGGEEGVGGMIGGPTGAYMSWYGIAGVLRYDFDLPILGGDGNDIGRWFLAVRGEWMEDPDGYRTSGALAVNDHARIYEVTGTVGFRASKMILIRFEVRYDHALLDLAGNPSPHAFADGTRDHQTTAAINIIANL
jgi:hypothetical protein